MKKIFAVVCLFAMVLALTGGAKTSNIILNIDLESGNMSAGRERQFFTNRTDDVLMTLIHPVIYTDENMKTMLEPTSERVKDGIYTAYIDDAGKLDSVYVVPPSHFVSREAEPITIDLLDENTMKDSVFSVENIEESEEWSYKTVEIDIKPEENGMKVWFAPKLFINNKEYSGVPNLRISNERLIAGVTMTYNIPKHIEIRKMELTADSTAVKTTDIQPQKIIIE